jgi:hypothetical protein
VSLLVREGVALHLHFAEDSVLGLLLELCLQR